MESCGILISGPVVCHHHPLAQAASATTLGGSKESLDDAGEQNNSLSASLSLLKHARAGGATIVAVQNGKDWNCKKKIRKGAHLHSKLSMLGIEDCQGQHNKSLRKLERPGKAMQCSFHSFRSASNYLARTRTCGSL